MSITETMPQPLEAFDFYTRIENYGEPRLNKNLRNMIGCMHPSCECRTQQRSKITTPGGGFGVATDRQIAHVARSGKPIRIESAIRKDYTERNTSELDVHLRCAYWANRTGITQEMNTPGNFTKSTIDRWQEIYQRDNITRGVIDEVIGAAGVLIEQLPDELPEGVQDDNQKIISLFAELYPGKNVYDVEPITHPVGTYVVSHLVNAVHDQSNRRHPDTPMAYRDSLGALVHATGNHGDVRDKVTAQLMKASSLVRSAAARSYIHNLHPQEMIEIQRQGKMIDISIIKENE